MITSVKPVVITLFSCVLLKEPCGLFEVFNLVLVIVGIFLVVQPPFLFNPTAPQYSGHMFYTSLGLLASQCLAATTTTIIRYLRDMHWATLAISTKVLNILELVVICAYLQLFCLPDDAAERLGILGLAFLGFAQQVVHIVSLKLEEAHVVGLVQNSLDILVSFALQMIVFRDIPGHWKVLGAALILTSVVSVGVKKVQSVNKYRKASKG